MTFDPESWKRLLEANHRWWRTPGAVAADNPFSDYDRDAILQENDHAPALLEALNAHLITTNSQCGMRETADMAKVPHPAYFRFLEKEGRVARGVVRRLRCMQQQRPYLVAVAPRSVWDACLAELADIGIHVTGPRDGTANRKFTAMLRRDAAGVNLTKVEFLNARGSIAWTDHPTNHGIADYDWRSGVKGLPPADLDGLDQATFVGPDYADDGGAMLRSVLDLAQRASAKV